MRWWWYIFCCNVLCGQSFLEEWTPARTTVLDTLTVNNCPPEWLWQWFGLSKEAVYAIVEYREYMGHIIDPIELVGLPGLTKQEIRDLAEKLPFSRERPKRNKNQLIFSGSLRNGLQIKTKFTGNHGRFEWGGLKELSITDGKYNPSKPITFFGATHKGVVKSKWLIGAHTLLLGEGLLSGSNSFGSSGSRERFGQGLRGTISTYGAVRNGFGASSQFENGRVYISLDEGTGMGGALEYMGDECTLGIGQVNGTGTAYFKRQWKSHRWFGEFTIQEQALGWNWWRDDLLFEGYLHRKEERLYSAFSMQWRDARGKWSLQLFEGRFKGNWQGEFLRYQCVASDEGTLRHRLSLPWEHRAVDLHFHGGTYGGSIRSSKRIGDWQLQSAVGWVHAETAPVWLAVPVATGFIGAKSVYDDFFGYHFKANTGKWSTSISYDFTEQFEEGFSMEWRYATALDQLRPMVPKIRIAFFNYRRMQKGNWKFDR